MADYREAMIAPEEVGQELSVKDALATLSTDDALALKQFFNSRNIEFKAIN